MIRYHLDENIHHAIAKGLRLRGIDVTTTAEVNLIGATDEQQLAFAQRRDRVLVTHDDDLLRLHQQGVPHASIACCHPRRRTIGQLVLALVSTRQDSAGRTAGRKCYSGIRDGISVFIQDWKGYEGWGALTKQPGDEGSSRGLILSLLVDHCLLLHPAQLAQLNHRQLAFTVSSLINRIKVDSLLEVFREILATADPAHQLQQLSDTLADCFDLRTSEKHMVGRDLGRMAPSPSLKYKAVT